jgi:hypothetical protein
VSEHYEVEIHRWGAWTLVRADRHSGQYATVEEAREFEQVVQPSAGLTRIVRVTNNGKRWQVSP